MVTGLRLVVSLSAGTQMLVKQASLDLGHKKAPAAEGADMIYGHWGYVPVVGAVQRDRLASISASTLGRDAPPHPLSSFLNGSKACTNERMKQWPIVRHFGPDVELEVESRQRCAVGEVE
jgi:hypothetical protein